MTSTGETGFSGEWLRFDEMDGATVHGLLKLRQDVFVVEQMCVYADIDGKDPQALHYLVRETGTGDLAGAVRLFIADEERGSARIGRVVTAPGFRGNGQGRQLMLAALSKAQELAPGTGIELSAQAYLVKFYAGFGFKPVSAEYLEDGIPHVDMALGR